MLSQRATATDNAPNLLHSAWYKQHSNPYAEITNPNGIINLGTAENHLLQDIVQAKLNTINLGNIPEEYTHYCKLSGTDEFKIALSCFFNKYMNPTEVIHDDDVFVMNGCGTAVEALGYTLCDEGDGILIPAPYYCGFKSDLEQRIGVKAYPVYLSSNSNDSKKPFSLTVERLEQVMIQAEQKGINIKALLLSNPNNPLGNIYTEEELESYVKFCSDYNIHLICDEIYMLCVYGENEKLTNVLSLKNIVQHRDNVHVIWGFSKDFGLSGFRCGTVITHNRQVQNALISVGYYTSVPTITQYVLEQFITDQLLLNTIIAKNKERLSTCSKFVTQELAKFKIQYVNPTSGFFVWVNFSSYLESKTKQSETKLFNLLMTNGVYIVPGFAFECKEYGWFRIIISHDINMLNIALQRIKRTLTSETFLKTGLKRHSYNNLAENKMYYRKSSLPLNIDAA